MTGVEVIPAEADLVLGGDLIDIVAGGKLGIREDAQVALRRTLVVQCHDDVI